MKKILFISNYRPSVGGISVHIDKLRNHLGKDGYETDIFSTKGTVWERIGMPRRLRQIIPNYNLIHIHCCSGLGFLPAVMGVPAAKKSGKRIVVTYHGGGAEKFFSRYPRLVKHYLLEAETVIVPSPFLGEIFDRHGIPYVIIPNIIELNRGGIQKRDKLRPRFISVRTHEQVYNIPCILRAFQIVQTQLPDAQLYLLGDGPQHALLMEMSKDMGLKNVVFTGLVANDKIGEYFLQSDIMLNAPKVDNMPVSLLEAMNAGLLVISSKVGGIPFMVEDGKTGLLFASDNYQMMAEKIMWALSHQKEVLRITENAYSEVLKYTWDETRDKIECIYNRGL